LIRDGNEVVIKNVADSSEENRRMQVLMSHCNVQETRVFSAFRELRQAQLSIATSLVQL
jgi:hypothetical protein